MTQNKAGLNPELYWKDRGKIFYKNFNFKDKLVKYQEQRVINYLKRTIERGELRTVMEIGCGFGRYTKLILELFPEINQYCAIDISSEQLKNAKKYVNDKRVLYVETTIQDYAQTEKYDLVFAGEILFHILQKDIENVIQKLLLLSRKHFIHIDPEQNYQRRELYFYDEEERIRDFAIFHDYESIIEKIDPHIKQQYEPMRIIHQAIYHVTVA
jgi:trans-aconitate methyltransferase